MSEQEALEGMARGGQAGGAIQETEARLVNGPPQLTFMGRLVAGLAAILALGIPFIVAAIQFSTLTTSVTYVREELNDLKQSQNGIQIKQDRDHDLLIQMNTDVVRMNKKLEQVETRLQELSGRVMQLEKGS